MKKGNIYKFHGNFERGNVVVGVFDGIDKETGFLKFKNIVEKGMTVYGCYDAKKAVAQELNGGIDTNCIGAHGAEAEEIIKNWFDGGEIPHAVLLHSEAMYNINSINSIVPMMNYFTEV